MDVMEKLTILTDAAKYDAACTSSGAQRGHRKGYIGNTSSSLAGCCHTFSGDGRCVTLLKVLMTNCCVYDCKYCVNRCSNDTRRAVFTPEELADLTIQFYRRNYIEGLFLSSGVLQSPDYTTERMIRCLDLLRNHYRFNGYIHAKAIPGTSPELVTQLGLLADRLSVNIELPSESGLKTLAPNKTRKAIFRPMGLITNTLHENKEELVKYRHVPKFAPAGQSTQMIRRCTTGTSCGGCSTPPMSPLWKIRCCPPSTPSLRCCGNTGCIRRIGCCGSTASGRRSCWTRRTPISTPWWTPSAAGP